MATSRELVTTDSTLSPNFIFRLPPAAERTAFLYHLFFLCLGGFPKLERLIRKQALDTQMLFGSSEAVLAKCEGTSFNLVKSVFPMLINAVEMKKPDLAVKNLEKAKAWIDDIIRAVNDIVKRYEQQNHNVHSCTSDVYEEKKKTEKKITQHSMEVKNLEEAVAKLEEELRETAKTLKEIERKYQVKSNELQNSYVQNQHPHYYISYYYCCYYYTNNCNYDNSAKTQALNAELLHLASEKSNLQNKEWMIQCKLTDLQLKLATSKIQKGEIPSPDHLKDVQKCLSQIQQILIELQKTWEKVGSLVDMLKNNTFAAEDLNDMKDNFVDFITLAKKYWQKFGECCQRAQHIFRLQSKDAYKFLETDPSSLSEAERNNQYHFIMGRLQQISPQASATPALTQF